MALFIGIFIALVVINILLLIFSSSLRYRADRRESRPQVRVPKSRIYSLKVRDSEYQEAV
jgi:hypothetical protein